MTWTKEDQRACDRRYRARTKEERAPQEAYRHYCYRERNFAMLSEKKAAWKKANPDRAREHARKAAQTPSQRAYQRKRSRLQVLAQCVDKVAQQSRILANADGAIPKQLNPELHAELRSMLVEAVYTGRFPIRLKSEHAQELLREHFRMFSKFTTLSLDEVIGDDGFTRGQAMGLC